MNQSLSPILFRYIGRRFLTSFMFVYAVLLVVIYLTDAIQIIKDLSKYNNFTIARAATMTALRLPETGMELMPFAVLIAAVYTFWRLTRTSELVVVRATGASVWQFLFAPFFVAVLLALLKMTVLNPISSVMLTHYEAMENKYLSLNSNSFNIASTGLWLRQDMGDGNMSILHADNIKLPQWKLTPVTAYFFDKNNQLTHRIDSETAQLTHAQWVFNNAQVSVIAGQGTQGLEPKFYDHLALPTPITIKDIEHRFASPRIISFWHLPQYARIMEATGFASSPLWEYFYNLLAEPFLNIALVILAATLALRSPRQQRGWWLVAGTLGVGFVVFFMGDFLEALGISERLPLIVAAFAPATISLLMGLTALLYLEDG